MRGGSHWLKVTGNENDVTAQFHESGYWKHQWWHGWGSWVRPPREIEREIKMADTILSLGALLCECSRGTVLGLPEVTKEPRGMREVDDHNHTIWQPRKRNDAISLSIQRVRQRACLLIIIDVHTLTNFSCLCPPGWGSLIWRKSRHGGWFAELTDRKIWDARPSKASFKPPAPRVNGS